MNHYYHITVKKKESMRKCMSLHMSFAGNTKCSFIYQHW